MLLFLCGDKMSEDIIEKEKKKTGKKFIIGYLISILIIYFVCFYDFPYYIDAPGGLDNINNRVEIENGYKAKGSINLTYVSELKGTLAFLVISYFHPDWTIHSKESANIGTLTYQTDLIRQRILMHQSYTTAIKYAYEKAKRDVSVEKEKCYVIYVFEDSKSELQVGDEIIKLDGISITSLEQIHELIKSKKAGDESVAVVLKNGKEYERKIKYYEEDGQTVVGIQLGVEYELKTDPKYDLTFDNLEYGPSGGLMISLSVYNSLVKEDITGGKKISGTGTLESDGTVGPVGGIEYKLKGAVKGGADVFFAPSEENYDEALKIKKKKKYKIDIVRVEKFEDALEYLEKNLVKK